MSYKVEALVAGEGEFISNALRYPDQEMAEQEGRSLASRWFAVKDWRVVESDDPVLYYDDAGNKVTAETVLSAEQQRKEA